MDIYNKKAAYIFVLAAVLVSVFVIGGNKLEGEANDLKDYFHTGDGNLPSPAYYLEKFEGSCSNLLTLAGNYDLKNNQLDDFKASLNHVSDSKSFFSKDFSGVNKSIYDLTQKAGEIINSLNTKSLKEKDKDYIVKIQADLKENNRFLANHSYNDEAVKFNNNLSNFYTKAIGAVRGIYKFPVFE